MPNRWLLSKKIDLIFLFLPVWAIWTVCFMLPESILNESVPLWMWVVFVLLIDVSHVWSSLFRTYLSKDDRQNHKKLLRYSPLVVFCFSFLLTLFSVSLFWTVLAYIAVYHFVKQQYGFFMLYKYKSGTFDQPKKWISDRFAIYLSMLYPILYWHLMLPSRSFNWFVENDFITLFNTPAPWLLNIFSTVYFLILLCWVIEEMYLYRLKGIGKILWLLTTALNWYLGIVYFNSDVAFTLTNVVAHGIPYMVLVIFYQHKKGGLDKPVNKKSAWVTAFKIINIIILFAIIEEYCWDLFVYQEKGGFFSAFFDYPISPFSAGILQSLFIALLTIPQFVHYIIDGYIWKNNPKNPHLKEILLK